MKKKNQSQTSELKLLYFLPPVFLIIVFAGLLIVNYSLVSKIRGMSLPPALQSKHIASYPSFRFAYEPYLSAKAAIVMDDKSKRVLFSKNNSIRFSTASTAKIMSALVALEHFSANDVLTVPDVQFEGTVVGFSPGEEVYFDDVLYSMMLPSGNDAAMTIASNYPGGVDAFVSRMNEKAREYHLANTHFADPSGLIDDGNYSTVRELAQLCSIALQNETLSRVVRTKSRVFTNLNGFQYTIYNIHRLLGSDGVVGVKTGQTHGAKEVLTTAKIEDGRTIIIVVMQSTDRFGDTRTLLNLVTNNLEYYTPDGVTLP